MKRMNRAARLIGRAVGPGVGRCLIKREWGPVVLRQAALTGCFGHYFKCYLVNFRGPGNKFTERDYGPGPVA